MIPAAVARAAAPRASNGNAALVEQKPATFELAEVGSAAIEVLRQCRCADAGSLSSHRLGDGRAINGDGLSHRVRSGLRRSRIRRMQRQREGGLNRSPNTSAVGGTADMPALAAA